MFRSKQVLCHNSLVTKLSKSVTDKLVTNTFVSGINLLYHIELEITAFKNIIFCNLQLGITGYNSYKYFTI